MIIWKILDCCVMYNLRAISGGYRRINGSEAIRRVIIDLNFV